MVAMADKRPWRPDSFLYYQSIKAWWLPVGMRVDANKNICYELLSSRDSRLRCFR